MILHQQKMSQGNWSKMHDKKTKPGLQQTLWVAVLNKISPRVIRFNFNFITAVCCLLGPSHQPIKGMLLQHKASVVTDTDGIFFFSSSSLDLCQVVPRVILSRGVWYVIFIYLFIFIFCQNTKKCAGYWENVRRLSPAGLWDPACVLCPGWRGQLCHRKCSHRGPPNLALRLDHPPSSDNWRQTKNTLKHSLVYREMEAQTVFDDSITDAAVVGCTWGSSWSCPQTVSVRGCSWEMLQKLHNMRSYKRNNRDVGEQEVYSYTYTLFSKALYF